MFDSDFIEEANQLVFETEQNLTNDCELKIYISRKCTTRWADCKSYCGPKSRI